MVNISGKTRDSLISERDAFNEALVGWGSRSLRDLPWRSTRNPWRVLVSEVMLQQTPVRRVEPKYLEFVELWPTPENLTQAQLSDLLKFWVGLGYPRRARNLYDAAHQIVNVHDGAVPSSLSQLMELPGVGPYTARAVMVFAFELQVGVVDTNVGRLLARWCGGPLQPKAAQELADDLVPVGDPWLWNQALFDLAASICTKRDPQCTQCPAEAWCSWRGAGQDPADGSAGVGKKQSRFHGSDRQARGKLMKGLSEGPVRVAEASAVMGLSDDPNRCARLVDDLLSEGLLTIKDEVLLLGDLLQ